MASTGEAWRVSRWPQTVQQLAGLAIIGGIIWTMLPAATGAEDPQGYVKVSAYDPRPNGMAISLRKTAGDSHDLNVDGGITVKHGKDYTATPGYADTMQVYTLAGSAGTILGNNNYVGSGGTPYDPPRTAAETQPNGYLRFELGPVWPLSEKMRLNNRGDLIVGWKPATVDGVFSQVGTRVTGSGFTRDMVGSFVMWTATRGVADRIVRYIDPRHVIVETPREIGWESAQVRAPRMMLHPETGSLMIDGAELFVRDGALMFRGGDGTVTEVAPR